MARLPLEQGIPRFKANEERIDIMTNGDENATWRTADGTEVPSVRKMFKDINTEGDSWLALAEAAADQASIYNQGPILDSVEALASDTTLSYAAGEDKVRVLPGQIVKTRDGFAYRVVALGSTDYDWSTAGGVLLYLLPSDAGHYNFAGMNPYATGLASGDDYPKLRRLLDRPGTGTGWYQSSPSVYLPLGRYFMSQTIQLKRTVHIFGDGSGLSGGDAATLVFPANTRGIIVHRYNTIDDTVESTPTTAGDGSIIEGIVLSGGGGTDINAHGVWLRARAIFRKVKITNFAGAGFRPYAAFNGTPDYIGNCNAWHISDSQILGCEWGVYASGTDANAGSCVAVDVRNNRRYGFLEDSFLGNTYMNCHAEANGRDPVNLRTAYATFGGGTYSAVTGAREAQLASTEPGTNNAIWYPCSPTSYALPWVAGNSGVFLAGGGYGGIGLNNRSTFVGCYNEGGQGVITLAQHMLWLGGFALETPVVSGAAIETRANRIWSRQPFAYAGGPISTGEAMTSQLGGDAGAAFAWSASGGAGDGHVWRLVPSGSGWRVSRANADTHIFAFNGATGNNYPLMPAMPSFELGSGFCRRLFGRVSYSDAAGVVLPTSGQYYRGDALLAPNPIAGDYAGLICTVSGVAGSTAVFKKFGSIAA